MVLEHRGFAPDSSLEAQPPTGLPSRPTCRGAGPFEVLKTQDSRATPGRPARFGQSTMPTSPIGALKGTGIRTVVPRKNGWPVLTTLIDLKVLLLFRENQAIFSREGLTDAMGRAAR